MDLREWKGRDKREKGEGTEGVKGKREEYREEKMYGKGRGGQALPQNL